MNQIRQAYYVCVNDWGTHNVLCIYVQYKNEDHKDDKYLMVTFHIYLSEIYVEWCIYIMNMYTCMMRIWMLLEIKKKF